MQRRDSAPLPTLRARHPPPVLPEQIEPVRVEGERDLRAGLDLGHRQALAQGDEGARGAVIEIEQRVLAERLDQANRQFDVARIGGADAAWTDAGGAHADMLRADAERGAPGPYRRKARWQREIEPGRAETD